MKIMKILSGVGVTCCLVFSISAFSQPLPYIIEMDTPPVLAKTALRGGTDKALLRKQLNLVTSQQKALLQEFKHSAMPLTVIAQHSRVGNFIVARLNHRQQQALAAMPGVKRVVEARKVKMHLADSLPLIGADDARQTRDLNDRALTGAGIRVAVIDTGIDYLHPDLGAGIGPTFKVLGGYDFVDNDPDPFDENGHGTHVAGIVAADGEVTGVAPDASLLAYRALDAFGSGLDSDIIAAIEMAVDPDGDPTTDDGAHVINLSLGGIGDVDSPMSLAVERAADAGVLMVVAAGNAGSFYTVASPANAPSALAVGASNLADEITSFSSRGPVLNLNAIKPEIVAPGESINSTQPNNEYARFSGTSMAAPHVAGAAALLMQYRPNFSAGTIRDWLISSARPIDAGIYEQGAGVLDLSRALQQSVIVSPTLFNLGELQELTRETPSVTRNFTLTNISDNEQQVTLETSPPEESKGISIDFSHPDVVIAPKASETIELAIDLTPEQIPLTDTWPASFQNTFTLNSSALQTRIPVVVHRSRLVSLSYDAPPLLIEFAGENTSWSGLYFDSIPKSIPVRPDTYQILSYYDGALLLDDELDLTESESVSLSLSPQRATTSSGFSAWQSPQGEHINIKHPSWDVATFFYRFISPSTGFGYSLIETQPLRTNFDTWPMDMTHYGVLSRSFERQRDIIAFNTPLNTDDPVQAAPLEYSTSPLRLSLSDHTLNDELIFAQSVADTLHQEAIDVSDIHAVNLYAPVLSPEQGLMNLTLSTENERQFSSLSLAHTEEGFNKVQLGLDTEFFSEFQTLYTPEDWSLQPSPLHWGGHGHMFRSLTSQFIRIGEPSNFLIPPQFDEVHLLRNYQNQGWQAPVNYQLYCEGDLLSEGTLQEQWDTASKTYTLDTELGCDTTRLQMAFHSTLGDNNFTQRIVQEYTNIDADTSLALRELFVTDAQGRTLQVTDNSGKVHLDVVAHTFNGVDNVDLSWRLGDGDWQPLTLANEGSTYTANLPVPNKLPQPVALRIQMASLLGSRTEQTLEGMFWFGTDDPAQLDQDSDGVVDAADLFPLDPSETNDFDADGTGDNADGDDDNDGIPDTWERRFGLNPMNAADANADPDRDGRTNLQEFSDNTDPTVAPPGSGSFGHLLLLLSLIVGTRRYFNKEF